MGVCWGMEVGPAPSVRHQCTRVSCCPLGSVSSLCDRGAPAGLGAELGGDAELTLHPKQLCCVGAVVTAHDAEPNRAPCARGQASALHGHSGLWRWWPKLGFSAAELDI